MIINGTQWLPATLTKAELEGWLRVRGISFNKNALPRSLEQKVIRHLNDVVDDKDNKTTIMNCLKNNISRHKPTPLSIEG